MKVNTKREREGEIQREMISRENKGTIHEKLQLLRSITSSEAVVNDTSIILDATTYIKEMKRKVEGLIHEHSSSPQRVGDDDHPSTDRVTVETLEKGIFLINVLSSERKSQGLLVAILEAFEGLGLDVHKARVSCSGPFRLEAIGEEAHGQVESMNAQVVKQAVVQVMDGCRRRN